MTEIILFFVGVTGLEPATAWSQTRNATNCATPRTKKIPFALQSYNNKFNYAKFS